MKTYDLICALRDFLQTELKGMSLPDPLMGQDVSPRVFIHNVPDRQDAAPGTYPFIIVRFAEGRTDDNQCRCEDEILLAVGIWAPDSQEQAGLLTAATLDFLRISFRSRRLIADRFEMIELEASQPEPQKQWNEYHLATVTTRWNYTIPRRAVGE